MHESKEDKFAWFTSRRGYIVSVTKEHTASFISRFSRRGLVLLRTHLNFYNRFLGFSLSCRTFYFFNTTNIFDTKY